MCTLAKVLIYRAGTQQAQEVDFRGVDGVPVMVLQLDQGPSCVAIVHLDAGEWCALPPGLGQDSQMPERFEGKWTGVSAVCPIGNDVSLERKLQTLQQPRVFSRRSWSFCRAFFLSSPRQGQWCSFCFLKNEFEIRLLQMLLPL